MSASRMGPRGNRRDVDGNFLTDADISRASGQAERPLQAWVDTGTPGGNDNVTNMILEASSDGKSWNQFAVNKKKFGIVPTYDEKFYTTEINKSHPEFAAREKRATQLAREIEGQSRGGIAHLVEEHAGTPDRDGDEEDLFSGVARNQPTWNHERTAHASGAAFAAKEAQKAMSSPQYVAEREKAERQVDAQKNSKHSRTKSEAGAKQRAAQRPSKSPDASGSSKPEPAAKVPSVNKSDQQSKQEQPKKKFNFAAAAAKGSSFKSTFSPSPGPSFSPTATHAHAGSVSPVQIARPPVAAFPGVMPGPMPVPLSGPLASPMPAPIPGAMPYPNVVSPPPGMSIPAPFGANMQPLGMGSPDPSEFTRDTRPVDVSKVERITKDDFSFIAHIKKKQEPLPKIYFTPPTWSGPSSNVFYVDQFPVQVPMPRMQMFMPPVGFMMPPRQY